MTGKYISAYLDELSIEHVTVSVSTTTRTCTTVLDKKSGDMTELIEPAGRISSAEREKIEETVKQLITESERLEGIALCGTLPPGLTGTIYTFICDLKPANCIVLLDAYQNAEWFVILKEINNTTRSLATGKIDILKINLEEARKLSQSNDNTEILAVGQKILAKYHLPILCITDGPGNAYLFESMSSEKCRVTRYTIPPLQDTIKDVDLLSSSKSPNSVASSLPEATGEAFLARVSSIGANLATMGLQSSQLLLNPLGAGDTCSAIFLLEYLDTKNAAIAFQHGLAAASASCLMIDSTSHFDVSVKNKIFETITSESLIL